MEAYELLLPVLAQKTYEQKGKQRLRQQTAKLIKIKKDLLRQKTSTVMEDLTLEMMHLLNYTDT